METHITKKTDLFFVDPRLIEIQDGFNTRTNFDLDGLDSIRTFGVQQPLTCYKAKGEERYFLLDGERRLRKVLQLIEEGVEIARVPVRVKGKPTDLDSAYMLLIHNDGKPLTQIELARTYKRLVDFGHTPDEIATRTGKPESHVLFIISLNELPEDVQDAIDSGKMSATQALELTEDVGEERAKAVVKKAKGEKIKIFKKSVVIAVTRRDIEKLGYDTTQMSDADFSIITDAVKKAYQVDKFTDVLTGICNEYEFPRK